MKFIGKKLIVDLDDITEAHPSECFGLIEITIHYKSGKGTCYRYDTRADRDEEFSNLCEAIRKAEGTN